MTAAARYSRVFVKLALVAMIWGGTFIAGRIATAEIAPATAALWRYVIASVALVAALLALEGRAPRLSGRQWIGIVALGATGVFAYNLCFMYGLKTVAASRAALIVALNPVFTALGAWLFFRDRLTASRLAGIALALIGALTVISHGRPLDLVGSGVGVGEALLLGCVASWVAYTLLGKRMLAGLSPLAATAYAAVAGTLMLAVVAAFSGGIAPPAASFAAWSGIVFLGLFGTAVAFVWYYEGVKAIGPARAAVFINLVPVTAVALGVLLLGESLDAAAALGGALTVAGVWLLNRAPTSLPPAVPESAASVGNA